MQKERQNELYENRPIFRPELHVLETPAQVDELVFLNLEAQILSKKNSVLTLPTGSSPIGVYKLLIEANHKGLDMSGLTTRNLDEYWPISKKHPQSYDFFMRDNLFNHVNIPESQIHIANGEAVNAQAEVSRFQNILDQTGPADLALIGIGPGLTCHIAFNERGSKVDSRTRLVNIDEETIQANARFFANADLVPRQALTQGIADILESKKIILIANGFGKAEGIRRTLEGPISSDAPASFLRLHPNVTFILDKDAASLLSK